MDAATRMMRVMEIHTELFDLANSFGGNETSHVASVLHEACNYIIRANKRFEAGGPTVETNVEDAFMYLRNNSAITELQECTQ